MDAARLPMTSAGCRLNRNLGLKWEHSGQSPAMVKVHAPEVVPTILLRETSREYRIISNSGFGAVQLPNPWHV
jgi:hypothetical protein